MPLQEILDRLDGEKPNFSSAEADLVLDRNLPNQGPFIDRIGVENEDSHQKMRRVDWRWAAAKGFLNKDTNQWNEEMGGREAYIRQRNERILARL